MRVYSHTLTMADLERAAARLGLQLVDGAELYEGPRTRRFDRVRLTSEAARAVPTSWQTIAALDGRYPMYAGHRRHHHATYWEHGEWMAELFDLDPTARIVAAKLYEGRDSFHAQTHGEFLTIPARLAYLRGELRRERISYSELAELQSLAEYIEPGDTELLEAAGVPEFPS